MAMLPAALVRAMPIAPIFRHDFRLNVNIGMGAMCVVFLLLMVDDWRKAGKVFSPYPVALALTRLPCS